MNFEVRGVGPLAASYADGGLYATWLSGQGVLETPGAQEELKRAMSWRQSAEEAPLWRSEFFSALLPARMADLAHGPQVVVTGQQPGFLGGPLYTLYKIATAIALAEQRSDMGEPTVAVFWSGDDDDDLAEALAPVGWLADARTLWQSPARGRLSDPTTQRAVLAEISPEIWADPLVVSGGSGDDLLARLQQILQAGARTKQGWGQGQAEMIAAVFAGTDLVVIRGNDERLHHLASPFYERLWQQNKELQTLVAERGAAMERAGFHAQINARSLANNLFRSHSGRRQKLGEETEKPTDWSCIRPGVMLRSLVQDWLLQPTAVVVGAGEFAYLRQLDPLYNELALPRCPLVPRLSGWVLPTGPEGGQYLARVSTALAGPSNRDDSRLGALADQVVDTARDKMQGILRDELRVSTTRAEAMAENRARRFRKGVLAMFAEEAKRQEKEDRADLPPWLLPHGQRQERALGWFSALDIWGEGLVPAILAAAAEHLEVGAENVWQQFALRAEEGKVSW